MAKVAIAPAPVEAAKTIDIARIDNNGLLLGVETVAADAVLEGKYVRLPEGNDMAARVGKYRWQSDPNNAMGGQWAPLAARGSTAALMAQPDAATAIAAGLMAVHLTRALPAATLAWLDDYAASIDAATADAELTALLAAWRKRKG